MTRLTRWLWGLPLLAAGCFNLPHFSQESLIDRPRILAVVADPPEVTPDTGTTLSIVTAGAKDVSDVQWSVCGMPSSQLGQGNQFGENNSDRACAQGSISLGQGESVTVPSGIVGAALDNDALLRAALGANLPASALDQIRMSVGFAATVDVELLADGKRLSALKRVIVSQSEHPSSNPPPPTFRFGDLIVSSMGDAPPYRCQSETGTLQAQPNQSVVLEPVLDGDTESWLESYKVLDARGVLGDRTEQGFYSWYATAGELDHGTTRAPDRSNIWRAPDKRGCVQLWLVVRDGHAGESACTAFVSVGEDECNASE